MVGIAGDGNSQDLPDGERRALGTRSDGSSDETIEQNGDAAESLKEQEQATNNSRRGQKEKNADPEAKKRNWLQNRPRNLGKRRGWKSPNKRWIVGGFLGGGLLAAVGIALLLLASSLMIPNLARNITELEAMQLARQSAYAITRVTSQVMAVQTASDQPTTGSQKSLREQIAEEYSGETPLLKKLNGTLLDKVSDNLSVADRIKFNYKKTNLGNEILDSIEVNGDLIAVPEQRGLLRQFIPSFLDPAWYRQLRSQATFADELTTALNRTLAESGDGAVANLVRSSTISAIIRRQLGIDLRVWTARKLLKYQKDTPAEAVTDTDVEAYNRATLNGTVPAETTGLVPDLDAASTASEQTVENAVQAAENGNSQPIKTALTDASNAANAQLADNIWKSTLKFLDPILNISLTSCILYEGSLEQAGPSMDHGMQMEMRDAVTVQSMADQQLAGQANANAIGGMQGKLGDVGNSNALMRARGETVNTLDNAISTQTNPLLTFTALDAMFGTTGAGGAFAKAVDATANAACPVLTDPKVAAVLAAINVIAIFASAGSGSIGEGAAEAGVDGVAEEVTTNVVSRVIASIAEKVAIQGLNGTMQRVALFVGKQLITVGAVAGATFLLKLIVMSRSSVLFNGLEHGADYADAADSGMNLIASEHARQEGGRPETCSEVTQNDTADAAYLADLNQQSSLYNRYLATSNTHSFLMQSADMVYGGATKLVTKTPDSITAMFLAPFSTLGSMLTSRFGIAAAEAPCDSLHYGNVQFGWSKTEESLIDSNHSYLPLENQKLLDQSGKADEIAQTYAPCFGYSYNSSGSSLDPTDPNSKLQSDITGSASMGTLLSGSDIVRTANSDVVPDQGLCSPQNLGVNNPTYGDLVFRFRLALSYDSKIDQLTNLQTVTN